MKPGQHIHLDITRHLLRFFLDLSFPPIYLKYFPFPEFVPPHHAHLNPTTPSIPFNKLVKQPLTQAYDKSGSEGS
jgi:hypothetical protein